MPAPQLPTHPVAEVEVLTEWIVAHVGRGHSCGTEWLFPGGFPGRPARGGLYRGLRDHLRIHLRRARSAALASLAAELPAAVLAHLLDININTAIAWASYAQTDWTAYLAARGKASRPSGSARLVQSR